MSDAWEPGHYDTILERLLPSETKPKFLGQCGRLAADLQRGGTLPGNRHRNGEAVRRMVWGIAGGRPQYVPGPTRTSRAGLPWTWAEQWFFKQAAHRNENAKHFAGVPEPTLDYIAACLCRPVADVVAYRKRQRDPLDTGGFGVG